MENMSLLIYSLWSNTLIELDPSVRLNKFSERLIETYKLHLVEVSPCLTMHLSNR